MAFPWKFNCSNWRMGRLVLLKFFVARISGNSFLKDGLEYCCLSGAVVICLLDPSLRVVLMYAMVKVSCFH